MKLDAEVRHNIAESRFELEHEGQLAIAQYHVDGEVMTFTHTLVPKELRGRGLASALARIALHSARQQSLKVRPACAFFAQYIEGHPETQDLLVA